MLTPKVATVIQSEIYSDKHYNYKTNESGNMTVTDISRTGLRIKLNFPKDFVPGDKLTLEFTLDDKERSFVNKEVVVRNAKGLSVGAEFFITEHYDKLGPYLLFNMS